MTSVALGGTGISVGKNGFGALPIQRVDAAAASCLLNRAVDNGFLTSTPRVSTPTARRR